MTIQRFFRMLRNGVLHVLEICAFPSLCFPVSRLRNGTRFPTPPASFRACEAEPGNFNPAPPHPPFPAPPPAAEKRTRPPPAYISYISIILAIFQMISFLTADLQTSPWPPSLSPLEFASSMTNLRGYRRFLNIGYIAAAVWLALAWMATLFLLLVWGVYCFAVRCQAFCAFPPRFFGALLLPRSQAAHPHPPPTHAHTHTHPAPLLTQVRSMPVTWPLKFISFMGNLSAGLLFIPLL